MKFPYDWVNTSGIEDRYSNRKLGNVQVKMFRTLRHRHRIWSDHEKVRLCLNKESPNPKPQFRFRNKVKIKLVNNDGWENGE